jgi:hypothetical protein
MPQGEAVNPIDARRGLIGRVACSRYVSRSARLRDLLVYLSSRVLEDPPRVSPPIRETAAEKGAQPRDVHRHSRLCDAQI